MSDTEASPYGSAPPSARLKLPAPTLTDPADVPADLLALRDALDPVTVVFLQGLAGAMPAAGVAGRYYWASDLKVLFYDDGTAWFQPGAVSPGDLKPTAGSAVPTGWLMCDGAQYARSDYAVLFNIIGLAWTTTDDGATFQVPDLRGRAPIGAGTGAGLTNRVLGVRGGEEAHAVSVGEMPSHGHGVNDPTHAHAVYDPPHGHNLSDPGHAHAIGNPPGNPGAAGWNAVTLTAGSGPKVPSNNNYAGGALGATSAAGTSMVVVGSATGIGIYGSGTGVSVGAAGGGAAHNNMPPFAAINWLVKT